MMMNNERENYLKIRAEKGDKGKFLGVLDKVKNTESDDFDT